MDLHGRSLLEEVDFTEAEFLFLVDLADQPLDGHVVTTTGVAQAENRLHTIMAAMVATIGDSTSAW